ncbi:helix-turn-helix domain-containing protein [Neobacillus sp. GCM10023253]|uniref:helix-turn-helix domain-containing protein n=1 Tax=Neobacillus sp. GCM10023253 TaxID=3252644 RepID=UPI00360D2B40
MEWVESVILYCLKKINNERTIYSVYHILKGKKSSQTIQDIHLYSLKRLFGVLEPLTRDSFEAIIHCMRDNGWIIEQGEQKYLLSSSGEQRLKNIGIPIFLNGWRYHQMTTIFWERLSLLVQVVSNLINQEPSYIPIQKNKKVLIWVKAVLKESHLSRNEIGEKLYEELNECFEDGQEIDPSMIVFRLTGFRQIGLTAQQASKKMNVNVYEYHLTFTNTLHYLIEKIETRWVNFPILTHLLKGLEHGDELTITARKTWKLLSQGYSIEMIAKNRNLKTSTIEDHLVEFALQIDRFSIDAFVDRELQLEILQIANQAATKQLKLIREKVSRASYFQIRLVLAKYGDRQWN